MSKVLVIGGGPGGYAAAIYCAKFGQEVTLVEKQDVGGTCLNRGCIPTKSFLQAAHHYRQIKSSAACGVTVDGEVKVDFAKTLKFKNKTVKRLRGGVEFLLKKNKVELLRGTARMLSPKTVELIDAEGVVTVLETDYIILATGSSEIVLPGFEADGDRILDSTRILDLDALPESLAIIGGGVIGVEFASVLNGFGKKVTIVEYCGRIIPFDDREVSETLRNSLEMQGVTIMTDAKANRIIEKTPDSITIEVLQKGTDPIQVTAEKLLVCVGRKANLYGIGLDEAGVQYTDKYIETDAHMQTNVPGIYAVGDITNSQQLAHVAYREAYIAAKNISGAAWEMDYSAVPACIYSHPEVSSVGLTEEAARKRYANVKISSESFSGNGKAMIEQEADGYVKMICDWDSGKLVGCSIIGPKATELITEAALLIQSERNVEDIANTIHAHPTLSELLGETAAEMFGEGLHT